MPNKRLAMLPRRICETKELCALCLTLLCIVGASCRAGMPQERMLIGETFLSKETFFEIPEDAQDSASEIRRITKFESGKEREELISLIAWNHVWLIDSARRALLSRFQFHRGAGIPALIDVDRDGIPEIMKRGRDLSSAILIDSTGKNIWKKPEGYIEGVAINYGATGDLNRDGVPEFYLAMTDGLACVDPTGAEIWKVGRGNDYSHVEVIGSDGEGEAQIVSMGTLRDTPERILEFRDSSGDLISRIISPKLYILNFRLLRWPDADSPPHVLFAARTSFLSPQKVLLMDVTGTVVQEYVFERWKFHRVEGTLVQFRDDEPPLLALLAGFKHMTPYAVLSLFSLDGQLVYQEVLPKTGGLLATRLKGDNRQGEVLLVGDGNGKVSVYRRAR